jgi:hypothetical protein
MQPIPFPYSASSSSSSSSSNDVSRTAQPPLPPLPHTQSASLISSSGSICLFDPSKHKHDGDSIYFFVPDHFPGFSGYVIHFLSILLAIPRGKKTNIECFFSFSFSFSSFFLSFFYLRRTAFADIHCFFSNQFIDNCRQLINFSPGLSRNSLAEYVDRRTVQAGGHACINRSVLNAALFEHGPMCSTKNEIIIGKTSSCPVW